MNVFDCNRFRGGRPNAKTLLKYIKNSIVSSVCQVMRIRNHFTTFYQIW